MNFEILLMEMAAKEKKNYVLELLKKLNTFSEFSGLKSNNAKCRIVCIRVLKAIEMVQRGMKCVNSKTVILKIIRIHFSYDKKLEQEKNMWTYHWDKKHFESLAYEANFDWNTNQCI